MNAYLSLSFVAVESTPGGVVVTRGMLRVRAVELADIAGRAPAETSKVDWEEAKRELMKNAVVRARTSSMAIPK